MPETLRDLMKQYIEAIREIYGMHVRQIILYGSYARGDFSPDSDVDLMILVDMSDMELKKYAQQLSYMTYDFYLASKEESERQILTANEFVALAEKYCLKRLEQHSEEGT